MDSHEWLCAHPSLRNQRSLIFYSIRASNTHTVDWELIVNGGCLINQLIHKKYSPGAVSVSWQILSDFSLKELDSGALDLELQPQSASMEIKRSIMRCAQFKNNYKYTHSLSQEITIWLIGWKGAIWNQINSWWTDKSLFKQISIFKPFSLSPHSFTLAVCTAVCWLLTSGAHLGVRWAPLFTGYHARSLELVKINQWCCLQYIALHTSRVGSLSDCLTIH